MDIHPPHGPVHSFKEFLLHLSIVTLGIVIALSLEGLLEWRHHRELVREARANIRREIEDNKKELDGALEKAPQVEQSQTSVLRFVEDQLAHRKAGVHNLNISYGIVQLRSSSWDTAQATGALGYMDYAEVKRYSETYALQKRLDTLQDQLLSHFINAMPPEDPERLSNDQLVAIRDAVLRTLSYLHASEQIAQTLSTQYGKVLAENPR